MNSKKNLKRNLLICLLAGSAVMYTLPLHAATSVIGNNTLPQNGQFVGGSAAGSIVQKGDLQLDVSQKYQNAVIKWDSFDVGGSATVNFSAEGAYANNFNTLNYINSGAASQIYGTINAQGGNIFIVNPAGVQIGNSAQINVGSLHVSNKNLDDAINKLFDDASKDETGNFYQTIGLPSELMANSTNTDAVLMSLGNINANKVTFEGDGRIVIDSERIKNAAGSAVNNDFKVHTNHAGNVLIGYDAYVDKDNNNDNLIDGYVGQDKTFSNNVYVNGKLDTNVKGYMWVEDVEQLQAINTNLSGNYALRNSIDATGTEQKHFTSIGSDNNAFKGKFDGIDYNIFGLNIKETGNNVGLFGYTDGATINNVTLVGGSITGGSITGGNITGGNNVGAVVGNANNTILNNVVNSAAVSGDSNVGGIVGSATNSAIKDAINTGTINGLGDNVGGLIGNLQDSKFSEATDITEEVEKGLIGNSYNLGDVSSKGHNVGGLVGSASNSTIGNPSVVNGKPVENVETVYNRMDVTGAYNVGGIVGNMEGSIVQNAENSGTVLASGSVEEDYIFHSDYAVNNYNKYDINGNAGNGSGNVYGKHDVDVANVGGIAGTSSGNSIITDVLNTGDVSSSKVEGQEYYAAGNVGGIVGKAVDTNISNATNKENEVRGAHNVGGIAGYFGGTGIIKTGINDGGDIMATGARNGNNFVTEIIRSGDNATEKFTVGNIGGVVGYMFGDNVYIDGGANRGTVHTDEPADPADVKAWQKAANVGGIVGKIDRASTKIINDNNVTAAAVSNSYNTGDVLGYTGIGGIAGMMYNGEIAKSYNLGYLRSTRQSQVGGSGKVIDALNMGGIVGDTTEESNAKVYLYDVYNKGQIGDKEFKYFGRHIGGIVGRLSGTVEKAYNTGAIYNGYNVVGGIVGWMHEGSVNNVFNTGNITVYNQNNVEGQIGGIVGAAHNTIGDINISNAYNLGTIRGFKGKGTAVSLGGILGFILAEGSHSVNISNVYTTGNLYADDGNLYSIYGAKGKGKCNINNAYYIKPDKENNLPFDDLSTKGRNNANGAINFNDKSNSENYGGFTFTTQSDGDVDGGSNVAVSDDNWRIYAGNTPILNAFLPDSEKYFAKYGLTDNSNNTNNTNKPFNGSIQYGTAYDPLLTIINTDRDLVFNFGTEDNELSITNAAGLAVYGGGVTLNNFTTNSGSGYFGGTIYADGALNLNGGANDIGLGSAADIYGSAVNITTNGKVTIYGDVTATGNGTKEGDNPNTNGSITITAGDVDVYGTLTSASNTQGATVTIPGIEDSAVTWTPGDINNPYASMADIADRFAHTTGASAVDGNITINAKTKLVVDDNDEPILDENGNKQYIGGGNVNLYFGNKEQGLITTGGNLTVTGTGDVYVDSDLDIGGNLTLNGTGADSEVLLTLTNIGKVQANRFTDIIEGAINGMNITADNRDELINRIEKAVNAAGTDHEFTKKEAGDIVDALIGSVVTDKHSKVEAINELNNDIAVEYMHDFMHSFDKNASAENKPGIYLNAASGDAKLTVDMWVENTNGSGQFNFEKYDTKFSGTTDNHTFKEELNNLNFAINDVTGNASESVYVEVSTGEQLKAIQNADSKALGYNYALMGDINASDVEDYVAIGTGNEIGFTGTFDGRGNRIIGLDTTKDSNGGNSNTLTNAGIFSSVGKGGVVKDVNIYSGTFTGTTTAGAVAGVNNGRIEGIVTFGNTVTVTGDNSNVSNAGGIVGVNNSGTFENNANDGELTGGIYDVESTGSVIAGSSTAVAGGLVGTNDGGLANSFSDSAVTVGINVTGGTSAGLGGVVGVNTEKGNVQYVDSLGVTNGGATGSSNIGGIIGTNNGNMYSGYNESIVSGNDKVGGIIGENKSGKTVSNVVNATSVTGATKGNDISEYVGGLVGVNSGSVTNGRNNGTITGVKYVGGMVGSNEADATLKNLVNDSSAAITGEQYVGGIAGDNAGTITTGNEETDETVNLINRGTITGQKYVGGVAGSNSGTITNANNDVELNVKDSTATGNDAAEYFGGIAGENTGTINNATNTADVNADGATYVGGIVGKNDGTLKDMAGNSGNVTGKNNVGGVAGKNNTALDGVIASNDGTVKATEGGAGGIFAENTGDITNSTLTNNKIVAGTGTTGATGGIIGVNSGNISRTSLKNEVDGQVIGMNNVGGLIGKNTGTIIGGRDDADSYYKYQIYNNGVINVGTWTDRDGDGVVDVDTKEFNAQAGSNIGGLIGNNADETAMGGKKGSLTAGYNTGAINASGSTNVGGIAGSNSGIIDQVFNTIMVADGALDLNGNKQSVAVTGGINVGGLVGNNQANGEIRNAYNTSTVTATGVTGNLVGTNSGTVQYVYGYGVDSIDELIGEVTDTGSISHGHAIGAAENSWFQQDVYEDFNFGANGWKIYNGSTLPMLSVFLTKVTVIDQHLVNQYFSAKHYGELHQITADDIKALIAIGAISAPDGFGAFNNNNGLIQGVADDAMANSGNWLYSQQILGSNINGLFNPNNLGYDISLVYSPFENEDWPNNHWNYLFNDAPFDRNKDFRERKAEVNFVDGGMEI